MHIFLILPLVWNGALFSDRSPCLCTAVKSCAQGVIYWLLGSTPVPLNENAAGQSMFCFGFFYSSEVNHINLSAHSFASTEI